MNPSRRHGQLLIHDRNEMTMQTWVQGCLGGIVMVLTMLVGTSSLAAETISVEVRSISADQRPHEIDESLADLEPQLEGAFDDYKSFELVERHSMTLEKGESSSQTLPEGSTIRLTFEGWRDDMIELDLEIADKLSTTLRASPGSTFFQAGLDYEDGILIVAITVGGEPPK